MSHDERDIIEALKAELNFIEKGGYGRSVKSPWQPTSMFEDSLICLNYSDPRKSHPCSECLLIDFVPLNKREKAIPCHHIPLNSAGDTIEELEWVLDQHRMEEEVESWLRSTVKQVEEDQQGELSWIT